MGPRRLITGNAVVMLIVVIGGVGGAAAAGIPDPEAPTPPQNLRFGDSQDGFLLMWDPPMSQGGSPVDTYRVYRIANMTRELVATLAPDQTSYEDTELDAMTSYAYYVTASNMQGESVPSNPAGSTYPWCQWLVVFPTPPRVYVQCFLPLPVGQGPASVHIDTESG